MMLEEKVELLTKEIVALRQTIEKNGLGGAAKAAAASSDDEKPAKAAKADKTAKGGKGKTKAVEPEHDADETGAIFRKAAKEDKPACRKFLKQKGCADLAELLTKPELFDEAYAFAEGILEAEDEDEDEDEDDDV